MQGIQTSLFDGEPAERDSRAWPSCARFPLNTRAATVRAVLQSDWAKASEVLLVAGFAALGELIDFIAGAPERLARIRILLGAEPLATHRKEFALAGATFPDQVAKYWLERGISLRQSAALLRCIEHLQSGRVAARYLDHPGGRQLHAKLYCSDRAVVLGSSNFTAAGLERQYEANVRFTPGDPRYAEVRQIAENFWALGTDYTAELVTLLEQLLRVVPWQEALARACAELLDGEWAAEYLEFIQLQGDAPLWPAQKAGIAQALYLIDTVGSVLVADATGSGKTRMGAWLLRAVLDRLWRMNRARRGNVFLLAPASVEPVWKREASSCQLPLETATHGIISRGHGEAHDRALLALRRALVLGVDEAHNFYNHGSNRTQRLFGNMADHAVLFTATPINKGPADLLHIVDLLGADNFPDSTLDALEALIRRGPRAVHMLTELQLTTLRNEIRRFTVRRTKAEFNRLIDQEPAAYRNRDGSRCRYPKHFAQRYTLNETEADRRIAAEIRALADRLRGLLWLKKIELPATLAREGWDEEKYLAARLLSASRLAAYQVMVSLRSSRAALVEHIVGTARALEQFGLPAGAKSRKSGGVLASLERLAGHPPPSRLRALLPDWLVDPAAHRAACEEEAALYRQLLELAGCLSSGREEAKARWLAILFRRKPLVLAFDRKPITLRVIEKLLAERVGADHVVVATGEDDQGKTRILRDFAPGAEAKRLIGLCSDSLSEGVNLQKADVLVHLDLPTVVRIAEQRVGRIDRLDSGHDKILVFWPDDAPEFALRADERFIERHQAVEELLGSNLPLPKEMLEQRERGRIVRTEELIQEVEENENEGPGWDGIEDAFAPVRHLVEGRQALVAPEIYADYRRIKARVLSRVSLVRAPSPWAFFCLQGSSEVAPKWILFPSPESGSETDLDAIARQLRLRLDAQVEDLPHSPAALRWLEHFLGRLQGSERQLLSRRKQRALEEMEAVLAAYRQRAAQARKQEMVDFLGKVLELLAGRTAEASLDWNALAERWLNLVKPALYTHLRQRKRAKPLRLRDIRGDLLGEMAIDDKHLLDALGSVPKVKPVEERVAAVILGVP